MTPPRKTTVTHPDGTVSKRSSVRAVYAFAVETTTDQRAAAEGDRKAAAEAEAEAVRLLTAFSPDDIIEEHRLFGGYGGQAKSDMVSVSLRAHDGGKDHWLRHYVIRPDGTIEDPIDVHAEIQKDLANYASNVAQRRATAARLDAGPAVKYGVARWSRTQALAEKGANEYRGYFANIRVVPVDPPKGT